MRTFLSMGIIIFIVGCSKFPFQESSRNRVSPNSIIIESSEPVVIQSEPISNLEPIIIEEDTNITTVNNNTIINNKNRNNIVTNNNINTNINENKKIPQPTPQIRKRRKRVPLTKEQKELRRIMKKFDYLIFNKINMEMLQGEEDMFFGKNIYPLLRDFVKDSKKIATLYPNADERYKKISNSLYKKAKVLEHIIKKRKTKYFKLQLNSIIDTCNLCHSLYN